MSDYIKRSDALNFTARVSAKPGMEEAIGDSVRAVMRHIEAIPAADVAPVRYAEWNKDNDAIVCSSCGFGMFPIFAWSKNGQHKRDTFYPRFCPDCGARMDA